MLHERGDPARIAAFVGRSSVKAAPPLLDALLVSGHHGCFWTGGQGGARRVIIDASGGVPAEGQPLQALLLPERVVVEHDGVCVSEWAVR